MDEAQIYEIKKLKNLESIKEFCNSHLLDIAAGTYKLNSHLVKVRFIDQNGNFGYTGLGYFFFIDDCMYMITKDPKYSEDHNPCILSFSEELDFLNHSGDFIVRVIFAGVFTGFNDDKNERIFTGDVVRAKILVNPEIPSSGGVNRARNLDGKAGGSICEAAVNEVFGNYSIILDNHSAPLSWATKLDVLGSLFYDLRRGQTEVEIQNLCGIFAQSRTNRDELRKLIKKSPCFPPVTWEEKAIELLCGNNKE